MRRVVVTGSECTGKTRLVEHLARRFGCPWAPEHARAYADRKGAPLGPEDVEPIARGQVEGEDRATAQAAELVLLDTDLVSTFLYARHYYGECPPWIEAAARQRRADLYLLLHPDIPWLPDGVRDRGDRRGEMHALFESVLAELGCRVVHVRGEWDERRATAERAVNEMSGDWQRGSHPGSGRSRSRRT